MPINWRRLWFKVTHLAEFLKQRGLASGDKLAIIAPNCLEWELMHLAGMAIGGVIIGLDGHETAQRMRKVLDNAAASVLVVKDGGMLDKLGEMSQRAKFVVLLSGGLDAKYTNLVLWEDIWKGIESPNHSEFSLPNRDHPATIIYTSGTTGEPKGILYTHGQLVLACRAIVGAFPTPAPDARFICWLPLSNLFQRVMNQCALMTGSSLYMVADPLKVLDLVAEIQPDVFIGVPRFFEKVANGIGGKIAQKQGATGAIARYALSVGARHAACKRAGVQLSLGLKLQYRLADRLVLARLRVLFGDRLQYLISGSAPMAPWVLEFFQSLGWLVLEAYGLSENILPMAMNTPREYRFGTVGRVLAENEIRIASDGEVMVRGPGVFTGYHGDADSLALVSENGFYRTGDYGAFDDAGFLRLTGRKSEIIKTSAGRRIALPPIESALREIPWVDHAVVLGSGRKCLAALLTVDRAAFPIPSAKLAVGHPKLRNELVARISRLERQEQPAAAILLQRPFSVDGGELTSNLKLRRLEIEHKYKSAIENLYAKLDGIPVNPVATEFLIEVHE